ncbi:unnamed protein product [Callosobruchus maculatus]|uniref:Uncharacterized protein n=1 Tax=Callosobruchus maculatus TaxID=64391 RepID=A0A653CZV7_CALMS|nr:unnamed protein product [Callosobruchus maculatus]
MKSLDFLLSSRHHRFIREQDDHREIKSIGHCEVAQSFVYFGSLIDNSGQKKAVGEETRATTKNFKC